MKTVERSGDFYNLFESAPGLYLVLSPDLKIVAVTNTYLKATLTNREDILGKGIFEVFPDNPDDPLASGVGNLSASLHRVLQTKVADTMAVQKYDIPKPEALGGGFEEKYWSPVNTPVFSSSGELQYIIHQVEDVTDFIQLKHKDSEHGKLTEELRVQANKMEAEIFRRAQEIQEVNKSLRDAEKVKSEFFANVSHELRTPLSLILAPLESVLSGSHGELSDRQTKSLQIVHNNAVRLLQMVNGLLDFSKFEAGKMKVHQEVVDIEALVRTIVNDFDSMMRGNHISLTHAIEVKNKYIETDRYLLERILFNLLSNAAKFTPHGGQVSTTVTLDSGCLSIVVADTGIGIPGKAMQDLFKKFSQVEGSSIRRFDGTGLGLAMVKEFAELMNGTVSVKSEVGKGSIFEVRLKVQEVSTPMESIQPEQHKHLVPKFNVSVLGEERSNAMTHGMKVLVCEDNAELSAYLVSLLQEFCQVKTATNGEEGLELTYSWQPDLVLSDVMMPKKNGFTLCADIKGDPGISKTTVVLLTAMTHRTAMLKGWEVKADDYLFKPFHPEEFVVRMRSLLATIEDRKKSERLLDEKTQQLAAINTELEAFSYSVSHDLRAPVRSITGYTQALEDDLRGKLDESSSKKLAAIKRNANKMNSLIQDLLNLAHTGKVALNTSLIDMDKLVSDVISDLKEAIPSSAQIKVNSLAHAHGDRALLIHVWINLITNAIKYSSKKEYPQIEIGSTANNGELIYAVSDNGAGFDMKYAHKLFGVFQRLHNENEFEGTGVGLATASRIIARHHGRMWANGEEGKGAIFYFTLPVSPSYDRVV